MMDFQKKYNLRRKNMMVDPPKKAPEGQTLASQSNKNLPRREVVQQKPTKKVFPKVTPPKKKIFQRKVDPNKKTCRKKK